MRGRAPGKSLYAILGAAQDADAAALKAAFRARALALHPDRHGSASAAVQAQTAASFKEVNSAWEVLGDPQRRAAYDNFLRRYGVEFPFDEADRTSGHGPPPTGPLWMTLLFAVTARTAFVSFDSQVGEGVGEGSTARGVESQQAPCTLQQRLRNSFYTFLKPPD